MDLLKAFVFLKQEIKLDSVKIQNQGIALLIFFDIVPYIRV